MPKNQPLPKTPADVPIDQNFISAFLKPKGKEEKKGPGRPSRRRKQKSSNTVDGKQPSSIDDIDVADLEESDSDDEEYHPGDDADDDSVPSEDEKMTPTSINWADSDTAEFLLEAVTTFLDFPKDKRPSVRKYSAAKSVKGTKTGRKRGEKGGFGGGGPTLKFFYFKASFPTRGFAVKKIPSR